MSLPTPRKRVTGIEFPGWNDLLGFWKQGPTRRPISTRKTDSLHGTSHPEGEGDMPRIAQSVNTGSSDPGFLQSTPAGHAAGLDPVPVIHLAPTSPTR
jgi:hypothetical protein